MAYIEKTEEWIIIVRS